MADLSCSVAEGLIGARAAGVIPPEGDRILDGHLERCETCRKLAAELETPLLSEAVVQASADGDFSELTVVPAENYVRGHEIGRGGMGQIVQAHDRRLGRAVAIKELIDAQLRARFEREARLTARLQHPAIVTVYEAGRWPSGDSFYAMKHVAGRPLDVVVAGMRTLDERLGLLTNLTTVVEAIAYAHSQKVVHRDLKPQNVLVGPFGETVVIDWGLAKDLTAPLDAATPFRADAGTLTAAGAGTPSYMAPEQARGDAPDERVDVFALGATIHHVLAGDRPDVRPLPPETPRDLRAIVVKAMAPDKEDRYRTAAELAGELRRFQAGQLVAAHRYSLGERLRRFARRNRTLLGASAVSLAMLAATGIIAVRRIIAERDQARAAQAEAVAHRRGAERLVDYLLHTLRPRLDKIGKVEILEGVGKEVADYFDSVPAAAEHEPAVLLRRAGGFEALALADFSKGRVGDGLREGTARARLCAQAFALLPTREAARCMVEARVRNGQMLSTRGNNREALEELAVARRALDAAVAVDPLDIELRIQLVELDRYRSRASYWARQLSDAHEAAVEGATTAERIVEEDPRNTAYLREAAISESDLAQMEVSDGHPERALAPYHRSIELAARARALDPDDIRAASAWALTVAAEAAAEDAAGDSPARARPARARHRGPPRAARERSRQRSGTCPPRLCAQRRLRGGHGLRRYERRTRLLRRGARDTDAHLRQGAGKREQCDQHRRRHAARRARGAGVRQSRGRPEGARAGVRRGGSLAATLAGRPDLAELPGRRAVPGREIGAARTAAREGSRARAGQPADRRRRVRVGLPALR